MKQTPEKKKATAADIITAAGLLITIYGLSIGTLLIPDKDFSEDENRYLQKKPEFSLEALIDGKFTAEISDYFADQLPLRDGFVGAKAVAEISLAKQENDDVLLGKDGHIIAKNDYADTSRIDANLDALKTFAKTTGTDLRVAIAGRSQDVLTSYAPALYPAEELSDKVFAYVNASLSELDTIELLAPLRARADAGEYVYYRTDHHWTTLGAYYAYAEIMNAYGIEPYPLDHFTVETASDAFYGTTWSKAGMKWIAPDTMEFFRYPGDETLVTEITDRDKTLEGMYDRSYLEVKDKYSAFIGGNNARVRIYPASGSPLADPSRETMVLIKDSFGHSLAPFLAAHFDLEIIDLRYYRLSVPALLDEVDADRILVVYNLDSLANGSSLAMLTIGGVG